MESEYHWNQDFDVHTQPDAAGYLFVGGVGEELLGGCDHRHRYWSDFGPPYSN
jgi:hypothetical protein